MNEESDYSIRNCENQFAFICPRTWESLSRQEEPGKRYCEVCQETVHLCRTNEEVAAHTRQGHCIAAKVAQASNPEEFNYVVGMSHSSILPRWQQELIADFPAGVQLQFKRREFFKALSLRAARNTRGRCDKCGSTFIAENKHCFVCQCNEELRRLGVEDLDVI